MYVLLTGKTPFDGNNDSEIEKAILNNEPDYDCCSELAIDLLKQMLEKDPLKRSSAKTCLEQKWFSSVNPFMKKSKKNAAGIAEIN